MTDKPETTAGGATPRMRIPQLHVRADESEVAISYTIVKEIRATLPIAAAVWATGITRDQLLRTAREGLDFYFPDSLADRLSRLPEEYVEILSEDLSVDSIEEL